jgi:hypothetical protein
VTKSRAKKSGNLNQWGTTDTAISGKKREE